MGVADLHFLVNKMSISDQIDQFLNGSLFAVVGASNDRSKYGNRVLRYYQRIGLEVIPINPKANVIEGLSAVDRLSSLDHLPHAISIITPPDVTEQIVREAVSLNIQHIWMQPGAESVESIRICDIAGINVLHSGPCILVDVPA